MANKNKKNDEFEEMLNIVDSTMRVARVMQWLTNPPLRWFEFTAYAIVGTGWMSLLMIFIWTGRLILLKIWATPIVIILILMCIIAGVKALQKKQENIFDKFTSPDHRMSKSDFLRLKHSLDEYNNYEKNVENIKIEIPTYKEYREYVLSIKPELVQHETLMKCWYTMFEQSKWTIAGFNVKDWKLQTKTIIEVLIGESLNKYTNFYTNKNNESGTNKI